ncbi:MAG: hypothetical protein ACOZBW_01905 [Thermodesulfobacteriota bacterium]
MRISVIGFLFWIAAGVLFAFKMIAALMERHIEIFTISQIVGNTDWVDQIPWPEVQKWALVLSETSLMVILLAIGAVFVVFGMFKKS